MHVTSLRKVYRNVAAVDSVSFKVEVGRVFYIIGPNGGPNGAGRTMATECLEGLRRPDGGSVFVAGLDRGGSRPDRPPPGGPGVRRSQLQNLCGTESSDR